MFLVYAALIALVSVPLLGGRLGALADVRLRRPWLVAAALGAQVVVTTLLPGLFDDAGSAVHLATYALLGAFLWSNRHLPGLLVVGAGAAANFAAITANGGVMPASPAALRSAGLPYDTAGEFSNSTALDDARLGFLGDVLAIPASWPASNVFSVGDVLILAGLLIALHTLADSRLRPGVAVEYVPVGRFVLVRAAGRWSGLRSVSLRLEVGEALCSPLPDPGAQAGRRRAAFAVEAERLRAAGADVRLLAAEGGTRRLPRG